MTEDKGEKKRFYTRRRLCRFCEDPNIKIDYKDIRLLKDFISERGKILPQRMTGNCAYHQRKIAKAIKRARVVALLPYGPPHI